MTDTKKITALARSRVTLKEDRLQAVASRAFIDPTGGGDTVTVYVNPDIAPPEAYEGYALRGAIMAALEGFRRYNRGQTRRHGTRADEQSQFETAYENALREIEELIHLTPTVSAFIPANLPAPANATAAETALTWAFPHAGKLLRLGAQTVQGVAELSDTMLLSVLTPAQVVQVRKEQVRLIGGNLPAPLTPEQPAEPAPGPEAAAQGQEGGNGAQQAAEPPAVVPATLKGQQTAAAAPTEAQEGDTATGQQAAPAAATAPSAPASPAPEGRKRRGA